MCSPANWRVFLWEKEGPLHKDELLCLTEESGGDCFLCLANQVNPGGHPPWACPLALVLHLAASGGVSFPPHLPEAGVEAISEDDPHSGRVSSHVSSYTSTLRGFCPVSVLAHQIWQLLSYAWDISLSLWGHGAVTSRKCVFAVASCGDLRAISAIHPGVWLPLRVPRHSPLHWPLRFASLTASELAI